MSNPSTKLSRIAFAAILGLAAADGLARANCPGGSPIIHGFTSSFEQCGANVAAFAWLHGRAVQRVIVAGSYESTGNTPAGHDSGLKQTLSDSVLTEGPNGAANGSYYGNTDFGDYLWDGCIFNVPENAVGCASGGTDFGVLDYVISGVDPSTPNVARFAVVSVDFNGLLQLYALDNAGAPAADGDPCGADALSFNPNPVNCAPIPIPTLVELTGDDLSLDVTLDIGDVSGIPVLDDCPIAETRSTNCPRNLYAGRILVYKRGTCVEGEVSTFDRRVYLYPASPSYGYATADANWRLFSPEDQNYNEALDPDEDGSNGGTVNGQLDPVLVDGTSPTTVSFRMSKVQDGMECLYFGMAIGLDANRLAINPPESTLYGEMVLSPMVSVNPAPIVIGGTLAPDVIMDLTALKIPGGATVEWVTGSERMTAGFNVFGVKRAGRELRLNPTLILAKEGTSGRGAGYFASFSAGQLKGCASIYVELVGTDGSRKRFGPAGL